MSTSRTRVFGKTLVLGALAFSLIVPGTAFADVLDQWDRQSPSYGTHTTYINPSPSTNGETATKTSPKVRLLADGGEAQQIQVLGSRIQAPVISGRSIDSPLVGYERLTSPLDQFLGQELRESVQPLRHAPNLEIKSATTLQSQPQVQSSATEHGVSPLDQFIGHELR